MVNRVLSTTLGVIGGIVGGITGYVLFFWILKQNFYAMVLPAASVGLGCGLLARHRSIPRGIACAIAGLWLGWSAPPDYQQSFTVRILFIHIPTAWMSEFVYACLAVASLLSLVWRQFLADCAAQAAAPLGAGFTLLTLATGSLWGRPEWGAWWVWDARLTSELVLFLVYLAYMALRAAIDDETRGARAAAILALVGPAK